MALKLVFKNLNNLLLIFVNVTDYFKTCDRIFKAVFIIHLFLTYAFKSYTWGLLLLFIASKQGYILVIYISISLDVGLLLSRK